ncbi:hypothetical protein FXB39_01600 [Nocardioides sp. BGMRC 2183]|nr:hypothetical protein FXB39_01600 [Nocardioides sp. BGMRC 2183]
MHLRKTLVAGGALVGASLLALSSTANAGPASSINYVHVDGATSGAQPISGAYEGGTANVAGLTFGCSGGNVSGTIDAGATAGGVVTVDYSALNLTCDGALGIDPVITLNSTTCATGTFEDSDATDGLSDVISGTVTLARNCGQLRQATCTANVDGTIGVTYDETTQDLILDGSGFTLSNQNAACLGFMSGGVTLNDITFDVDDVIDFRTNP